MAVNFFFLMKSLGTYAASLVNISSLSNKLKEKQMPSSVRRGVNRSRTPFVQSFPDQMHSSTVALNLGCT